MDGADKSYGAAQAGALEVEGVRIAYAEHGPARIMSNTAPVVMIHGASASLRDLEIALLPAAARGRRVILFDRPGHGDSQRPRPPKGDALRAPHNPFAQARLLRQAAAARGAERAVLCAHSLGGAVALAWALDAPETVAGLVLAAPVSHPWPGGVDWRHHAAILPGAGVLFRRGVIPFLGPIMAQRHMKPPLPADYYARAQLGRIFRPAAFHANSEDIRHLARHIKEMSTRYGELAMPMRIIVGDWDFTVSPMIHAYALAQEAQDAELTVARRVGHYIQHARPDLILAALDDLV